MIHRTRLKQKKVEAFKRKKTINDTVGFALQLMKMIRQLRGFSHVIVEEQQNGYVSGKNVSCVICDVLILT